MILNQQEMEAWLREELARQKKHSGMGTLLNMEAVGCDAEKRQIEICHLVDAWAENINGTTHGGIIAAVLDTAMGTLCRCYLQPDNSTATINLNINYLRPVRTGEKLYARAELIRHGRNLLWLRAVAWTADVEKPCATGEGTFYKISPKDK